MMRCIGVLLSVVNLLSWSSCGGDEGDGLCDAIAQTGCKGGLVCEQVEGGDPACFEPLVVQGTVFDIADDAAVSGARVVALDPNGAPVSPVAISNASGSYELQLPAVRNLEGEPFGAQITLRADAAGYQTFPSGLRLALPINTANPAEQDGKLVVASAQTEVGLIALPEDSGTGQIHGTVDMPPEQSGVLVVAETADGTVGFSAVADRDGSYRIFNIPSGSYSVRGYARGWNYDPVELELAAGGQEVADLALSDQPAATLHGRVEIVDPGQGTGTSIILVVESTFDPVLVRGQTPPGLRAPELGIEPNVTGDFTITGIPAGRYAILASFENDYLVRDPDTCIAGTEIVRQTITAGEELTLAQSFKVTGSLEVVSPGAAEPEAVSGTPTLQWQADASASQYRVSVVDALGNETWNTTVDGLAGEPSVTYGGPPLETGMYYQFRVVSVRENGPVDTCEISQTEDLKGVFYIP